MTFDEIYNKGEPYWTVFAIRFPDYKLAEAYAHHKANQYGNPVKIIQYDDANRAGFMLYTVNPTPENDND